MSAPARPPREISGKGRTTRELLAGRKYSINYYQREYKWQRKQVAGLIDDLSAKFHAWLKKSDLDRRQDLYHLLAERIWDPERPVQEAMS